MTKQNNTTMKLMRSKQTKISYHTEEFLTKVIQKQLDLHGAKYEEIKNMKDGKMPNGEFWYHHYKFETKEQHTEWKKYCIEELRNSKERPTKKRAEQIFMWIDLQWGLKQQWEYEELTANTK